MRNKTLDIEVIITEVLKTPKILCFTEHWCSKNELRCLRIQGYELVASYSRCEGMRGGCCVLAASGLMCMEYDLKQYCINYDIECACALDEVNKILILCVYRSPAGCVDKFFEQLNKIIDNIDKKFAKHKKIICGDFNICLMRDNQRSKSFRDILLQHNFTQKITVPTRITARSKSLIDNIFVNFDFNNELQCVVVNTALSDHQGQAIELDLEHAPVVDKKKYDRVFSKNKLDQFTYEVSQFSWVDVYSVEADSDRAYEVFVTKILDLMEIIFVPKNTKHHTKNISWITYGIRVSCRNKRKLYISRNRGLITNEFYKQYCNVLKNVIVMAKKIENVRYLENSRNKGRAVWDLIDQYTGKSGKKQSILKNMDSADDPEAAELVLNRVNKHFINICPKLATGATPIKTQRNNTMFLHPVTEEEVFNAIKNLKNTSSVGDDEIPTKLIKSIASHITGPLSHIINITFQTGTFPKRLKEAKIIPVFKKGEKNNINNYRPIAILNNFSKVFEKIIANRLIDFLEKGKILNENQNGFRKGKSTVRAVYMALIEILHSLNADKETVAVCLDLTKAFDSVEHNNLIKKLESYGIRGVALKLISSYLSERTQYVAERMTDGKLLKSKTMIIKRGVPQGSILGPLLYIIYTNELPSILSEKILQFADDTSIIVSSREGGDILKENISTAIKTLQRWFNTNNLTLNVNKTQILKFSYHQSKEMLAIPYNDTFITSSERIDFLGIGLDSRLDWSYHIDSLLSKTGRYAYALKMMSLYIDIHTSLTAYHAHVHSRLAYGIIFWGASKDFIRPFRLQKKCIRNILGLNFRDSCRNYFEQIRVLTLPSVYILECTMFVKKNMDLFDNASHSHNTRNRGNVVSARYRYSFLQKNVEHMITKIYNRVPIEIRDLPLYKIKKQMRDILLRKAYYNVQEFLDDKDFNM